MEKKEQQEINECVATAYTKACAIYDKTPWHNIRWKPFRKCSAETCEIDGYIFLRSYATIVAVYSPDEKTVYDFLRLVYGYTSTSAQHIAKFRRYCQGRFNTLVPCYSYKNI